MIYWHFNWSKPMQLSDLFALSLTFTRLPLFLITKIFFSIIHKNCIRAHADDDGDISYFKSFYAVSSHVIIMCSYTSLKTSHFNLWINFTIWLMDNISGKSPYIKWLLLMICTFIACCLFDCSPERKKPLLKFIM